MIPFRNLLKIYISILTTIILLKVILWIKMDYPIGRLSIIYLVSMILVLYFRNRITFILLIVLCVLPFALRFIDLHLSGPTSLEYTFAFYKYLFEDHRKIALVFIQFPYYFSALLCLSLLFKNVRLLYGFQK